MKIQINPQSPGRLAQQKIIALNIRTGFQDRFFFGVKKKKEEEDQGQFSLFFPV